MTEKNPEIEIQKKPVDLLIEALPKYPKDELFSMKAMAEIAGIELPDNPEDKDVVIADLTNTLKDKGYLIQTDDALTPQIDYSKFDRNDEAGS